MGPLTQKVLLALNTYPQPGAVQLWRNAVARAAQAGIDAVILADPGLMRYASERFPDLRLHLSVQGSATSADAINFYQRHFNVARAPVVFTASQRPMPIASVIGGTCATGSEGRMTAEK